MCSTAVMVLKHGDTSDLHTATAEYDCQYPRDDKSRVVLVLLRLRNDWHSTHEEHARSIIYIIIYYNMIIIIIIIITRRVIQ